MIPLLALGIPGSTVAAILVSVFLIHGITVSPAIFRQDGGLVFGLFAGGLIGIVIYGLIGFFAGPVVGRLVSVLPPGKIYPFVFLTAFVAAYSARNNLMDVLTRRAEESLRQSLIISDNGPLIFVERPFAIACFALTAVMVTLRVRALRRK